MTGYKVEDVRGTARHDSKDALLEAMNRYMLEALATVVVGTQGKAPPEVELGDWRPDGSATCRFFVEGVEVYRVEVSSTTAADDELVISMDGRWVAAGLREVGLEQAALAVEKAAAEATQ